MRNHYDFEFNIESMKIFFQSYVCLAENANMLIGKIAPQSLRKAIHQIKIQYENQFIKDFEKMNMINSTLNLIQRQAVTNVDELFIGLATEINQYYGTDHIVLQKRLPFNLKCSKCNVPVANCSNGLKHHEYRCRVNQGARKEKKKVIVDDKEKYQKRQQLFKNSLKQGQQIIQQEQEVKVPKKMKLAQKKKEKKQSKKLSEDTKIIQNDMKKNKKKKNSFNLSDDDEMIYYQENDFNLISEPREQQNQRIQQYKCTLRPTQDCLQNIKSENQQSFEDIEDQDEDRALAQMFENFSQ